MSRSERTQFNIRSAYARQRAHELARQTGMTASEVVEEALRAYVPGTESSAVGRLVRRGRILVLPASGRRITAKQAEEALNATRDERS